MNHEVTYRHIRCHKLNTKDDLPFLLNTMNSAPTTEALIIINTQNSFDIDPTFLPAKDRSIFPVLVVTAETGQSLMDALSKSEIEVKTELPVTFDPTLATGSKKSQGLSWLCLHVCVITTSEVQSNCFFFLVTEVRLSGGQFSDSSLSSVNSSIGGSLVPIGPVTNGKCKLG